MLRWVDRVAHRRSFFSPLIGDGRPLLLAMAGGLMFAGGLAIFLSATGDFLPHDVHFLGMTADDLCSIAECRIVDFMVHDRGAFGGTLFALGVVYVWLVAFPLSSGEQWAWWTLLLSGTIGFLGFLTYIGSGYLDTWHGIGTLLLLPLFAVGLYRSRTLLAEPLSLRSLRRSPPWLETRDRVTLGRVVLLIGALATAGGGLAVLRVGVGDTFVPEDLEFIGLTAAELDAINAHLVPLLAHDRIGFGSGVLTLGVTTALCLWFGPLSRHLHQAVLTAGVVSLAAALSVHFVVGYTDFWHLVPPGIAAASLIAGGALQHPGYSKAPTPGELRSSIR
jgi:hypothetical protein